MIQCWNCTAVIGGESTTNGLTEPHINQKPTDFKGFTLCEDCEETLFTKGWLAKESNCRQVDRVKVLFKSGNLYKVTNEFYWPLVITDRFNEKILPKSCLIKR